MLTSHGIRGVVMDDRPRKNDMHTREPRFYVHHRLTRCVIVICAVDAEGGRDPPNVAVINILCTCY